MSLLLDALKRAEQEKLARQGPSGPEPTPEAPLSRSTAAFELEAIESARPSMLMPASGPAFSSPPPAAAATSTAPARPATSAGPAAGDRANAQAIFAAKVPRPAATGPSKAPLFVGAAVIVMLVVAGAAYVWLQLNAINAPRQVPPARPPAPPPVTSSSVIRNVTPLTSTPIVAEPPAPLMPPAAPVPPPASGVAPGYPRVRPESAPSGAHPPSPQAAYDADSAVAGLLQRNAQRSAAPDPLRLAKSAEQPRVASDVNTGYDWLVRGDLQAARRSYTAALAIEPNNIDALLGLATVDARSGERAAAARSYRRVLAADPRNAAALAGLAAVSDYSRPEALESSLQADIQRYPSSAALRVALGNLYASQARWTEAQDVFFEAHRLEPDNADVLFNLAVALDHLKQSRLAAEYYGKALAQANSSVVQFDIRAVERRVADLKR